MQNTGTVRLLSQVVFGAAISLSACGAMSADDETTSTQQAAIKQTVHGLTKAARTAKDFSQIIEKCQSALDGELSESDRSYLKSLKSWALNRRCEKRVELATDFIAAGNDRQALLVKDEALADAIEAIALDDTRWRAFLNRGILLAEADLLAEGLADFQTVCRLQPKESVGWFNCGEIQAALKNYSQALDCYGRALELDPADLQALTGRGLVRCRLGDYDNGLKDFEIVLRMRGSDASAFINRGDARQGLGQWRDAYDDYVRAAEMLGDGLAAERTAWLLATCPAEEFYRPDTALDLARHSIALAGETAGNLEALAAAYACKGDFDQAIEAQRKAIALGASGDVARRDRLQLYEKQKPFAQPAHRIENGQMRASTTSTSESDKE